MPISCVPAFMTNIQPPLSGQKLYPNMKAYVLLNSCYSPDRFHGVVHDNKQSNKGSFQFILKTQTPVFTLRNDAFQSVQKNVTKFAATSYFDTDPVLWMLAECGSGLYYRRFGGTRCLRLQSREVVN
jgi:hypothetical protein